MDAIASNAVTRFREKMCSALSLRVGRTAAPGKSINRSRPLHQGRRKRFVR